MTTLHRHSVEDRHRFNADPDPNVHIDAVPDPDRNQNGFDPHADPTPGFTLVGKSEFFTSSHSITSLQSFSSVSSTVPVQYIEILWKKFINFFICLELIPIRIGMPYPDPDPNLAK
jgi:hypothetical protein